MTATDSPSTPVVVEEEQPASFAKKDKKKKKKHKKKKSRRHSDADADAIASDDDTGRHEREGRGGGDDSNGSSRDCAREEVIVDDDGAATAGGMEEERATREKKSKKKKKKDKKRKRSSGGDGIGENGDGDDPVREEDEDSSSSRGGGKNEKPKKKKRKKSSKGPKDAGGKDPGDDERIVSSSAIEYLPDDLKHLQLKKNQEEAAALPKKTKLDEASVEGRGAVARPNNGSPSSVADPNGVTKDGKRNNNNVTLLLFYQYVEPPWDESQYRTAYETVSGLGETHNLTGRMRIAREGLNCTLTGSPADVRAWCAALRKFDGGRGKDGKTEFAETEFKLTDDLPPGQRFPKLNAFEVAELVNYGLAGDRAPAIADHGGTHLEPAAYHEKMSNGDDTVVIDVRNHYEANIGRFVPPPGGARVIDPGMRKSTEFPLWLDRKETKEMLRGKQVLMYCTGGVRCERASALLRQKIDEEEDTKELGIKGVYQLQGGVDKYFKEFPEGGMWKGKNYTFDKRFAHAPPAVEALERKKKVLGDVGNGEGVDDGALNLSEPAMGRCEACRKPWDMYRGKRRCPTCGVPSLICRECFEADRDGTKKLGRDVRCDLCTTQGVKSKREIREREERETREYERKHRRRRNGETPTSAPRGEEDGGTDFANRSPRPNPEGITRLFLGNMCARRMEDEGRLLALLRPARVTHVQRLMDRQTGKFYGSAFVEARTAEDAGSVLALNGRMVLGRKMKVKYQRADEKSIWPLPNTEVKS